MPGLTQEPNQDITKTFQFVHNNSPDNSHLRQREGEVFDPAAPHLSALKTEGFSYQGFHSCTFPSTKVML